MLSIAEIIGFINSFCLVEFDGTNI